MDQDLLRQRIEYVLREMHELEKARPTFVEYKTARNAAVFFAVTTACALMLAAYFYLRR